ncbi:MAG TPA: sulfatase-like hydrolase/transferase [Pyrinomonadaceae bacterium]|nr:sulfatase-like hydrolase/transferase [Pyrinomonadaceae bacterium]
MSRKVTRREFVTTALTGTALTGVAIARAASVSGLTSSSAPRRPNILFILADDLGYGDLSCYGRPDYQTPHLDRLATQGVRFVNSYSASPVCTPTRCAFITGRYPARTRVGLEEPLTEPRDLGERVKTLGLPPEHPTIASLLKRSGYQTALIGKWHLGYLPNFGPVQSGFDEFFGIMSGAADFFTHKDMAGDSDLYEGKVPVERIGYTTEMLTQRAVEYIGSKGKARTTSNPFYLSLHYTAPHWPWEGPHDQAVSRALKGGYDGFTAGGSLKTYAAMMKSLDDGIGEVLQTLDRAGMASNTLVIFTSDNGGERFSYNWPFRGEKFSLWEGGIRVPAMVRWPGVVPVGAVTQQTAITMDWTRTMLAAGDAKPDPAYPLDGHDLVPVLQGTQSPYERTLFWRTSIQDAVLKGRWKYVRDGKQEYLFDLAVDEREQANYREQNPMMFTGLRDEFRKWESTVLPRPPARQR